MPVARAAGLEVVGVPVGDDGIDVDALDRLDADALVLTPSHQWPTGAVLSAAARAPPCCAGRSERDALIVEDDYDAEYRYDRAPIGAMQGLAPDRVDLRRHREQDAGARAAARLAGRAAAAGRRDRRGQDAGRPRLAGARPARVRRLPRARRVRPPPAADAARSTGAAATPCSPRCGTELPELEPAGIAAGLHLVAYLPRDLDEAAVVEAAARRGVAIYGLAPYRLVARGRPGLIFGYATLGERTIGEGVRLLAEAVRT